MKNTLLISAALLVLLAAGCGAGPVVWQKTLNTGGDETATEPLAGHRSIVGACRAVGKRRDGPSRIPPA